VANGEKKLMNPLAHREPPFLPKATRVIAPGEAPEETVAGATANPFAKFAIGALAGVTAVLAPRLLALLSQNDDAAIALFPPAYYYLAAGAGLFLGLMMLVFEHRVTAKPKETFMAALALPAVLAGAFGTGNGAGSVSELEAEVARLRQAVGQEQGIAKRGAVSTIVPLGAAAPAKPAAKGSSLGVPFIGTAHAQALAQASSADSSIRFGIRAEQPKYIVVLQKAATESEALEAAQQLRRKLPTAQAVKADKSYFVVLGNAPAGETDALLAAARAKKAMNNQLQPVLVEVKK